MSQRGAYRWVVAESGGTVTESGVQLQRRNARQKNDYTIPTPESHIARLYNFTPQRTVPCLSTHPSLLDTPREPPWIEGRVLDPIPRKLCRCSTGL